MFLNFDLGLKFTKIYNLDGDVRGAHSRRAVVLLERGQLEDKHLRLMEENLVRWVLLASINYKPV